MDKVIVFGGVYRNTMGVVRSLGIKGIPIVLLLRTNRRDGGLPSKYVTRTYLLDEEEEALDILRREYFDEGKKTILFCTSDKAICLMDRHYDEMKEHFYIYNANGEQGRINKFLDKLNTFPEAEKSGFTIIKTWHITNPHDIPEDVVYPCLAKGNNSARMGRNMHICKTKDELQACLQDGADFLVQEYIRKEYEINIVGLAYNHGRDVYVPAVVRKIRDEIGRQSVYIRLDDIRDYPNLDVKSINSLVGNIGYEGMFSVELIYSNGKYYFLEINLRGDDCCWLYTAAGINYPYLWVKYCNGDLDPGVLESIKFKTHLHLMALYDIYNVMEGKVPVFRWLKECFTADTHFYLNWRDMGPFFSGMRVHIRQLFKKIWRKIA